MRWCVCKAPSNNEMPLTIEIPKRVFKDFIFFAKRHVYYKFPTKRNQKPPIPRKAAFDFSCVGFLSFLKIPLDLCIVK